MTARQVPGRASQRSSAQSRAATSRGSGKGISERNSGRGQEDRGTSGGTDAMVKALHLQKTNILMDLI